MSLEAAKKLLAAVEEALPLADEIYKHTNDWVAGEDPPALLKFSGSYREAVDPETLEKFRTLTAFLTDALFGVDCDNDHAVRFAFVDQGREENLLPFRRVARVDSYEDSLEKRFHHWKGIQDIADTAQSKADREKEFLDGDIKKLVMLDALRRAAVECETCEGKGWIKTTEEALEGYWYGIYCEGWGIGAYRNGPFRLPCECQSERRLNGWPLRKRESDD